MELAKIFSLMLIGLGSGIVVAGAVVAFITVVGVVPRLAQKTQTAQHVKLYESAIVAGGIFGVLVGFFDFYLPIGTIAVAVLSICVGVFFGCLAMSLAEVLNVLPILTRRGRIEKGMFFFIIAIAAGKLIGSLLYFLVPGFYDPGNM